MESINMKLMVSRHCFWCTLLMLIGIFRIQRFSQLWNFRLCLIWTFWLWNAWRGLNTLERISLIWRPKLILRFLLHSLLKLLSSLFLHLFKSYSFFFFYLCIFLFKSCKIIIIKKRFLWFFINISLSLRSGRSWLASEGSLKRFILLGFKRRIYTVIRFELWLSRRFLLFWIRSWLLMF